MTQKTPHPAVPDRAAAPYRQDDRPVWATNSATTTGIGPALATEVQHRNLPGVRVVTTDGEPIGLLDAWAGGMLAVVIDAGSLATRPQSLVVHEDTARWCCKIVVCQRE